MFWPEIEFPVGSSDIKAHPLLVGNETKSWDVYLPLITLHVITLHYNETKNLEVYLPLVTLHYITLTYTTLHYNDTKSWEN